MKNNKLIEKIELPLVPIYDGKESIVQYERKFNEYLDALIKIKYNIILKFLNLWLDKYQIKLRRIIDFKNINKNKILSDKKFNKKILKMYSEQIYEYFNISEQSFENVDSDEIEEDDIIQFLKRILSKINYGIYKKECDNYTYYSIINKNIKE